MGLPTISTSDFTGVLKLSTNRFTSSLLTAYISEYREKWMRELLGDELFIAIRDDSAPLQRYTDLLDGVEYENTDLDKQVKMDGLTEVLKYCIFFQFIREQRYLNTLTGVEVSKNENSQANMSANAYIFGWKRLNDGLTIWNEKIVPFLRFYESISEEVTNSVDNGGGSYTLSIPSTKYLDTASTLIIGADSYSVSAVTTDTSVSITGAPTGQDYTGETVSWEPYGEKRFRKQQIGFF